MSASCGQMNGVTSRLLPSGLPREAGYRAGFAAMTGCLLLAADAAADAEWVRP